MTNQVNDQVNASAFLSSPGVAPMARGQLSCTSHYLLKKPRAAAGCEYRVGIIFNFIHHIYGSN